MPKLELLKGTEPEMKKLKEVEQAKSLMNEAMGWSVFKWLWEKSTVRETADAANITLDRLNRKIKKQWSEDLQAAYRSISSQPRNGNGKASNLSAVDSEILRLVQQVKLSDDKARLAREDAEETFDEAERQMSTSLAREGCKKAIHSWSLHEKAIREAENLVGTHAEGDRITS
jgi:hypothetical protein